jgi:hypothetical protein
MKRGLLQQNESLQWKERAHGRTQISEAYSVPWPERMPSFLKRSICVLVLMFRNLSQSWNGLDIPRLPAGAEIQRTPPQ